MFKKVLVAATAVGLLTACAARWDVEGVAALDAAGPEFNQALHQEYVTLAEAERDRFDWRDTARYLAKARAAAAGETVLPQPVGDRRIGGDDATMTTAARATLLERLDGSARTNNATQAASAQAGFDCWLEELEEAHQPEDIAACRTKFENAMAAIAAPVSAPAAPAPAPQPEAVVETGPFLVFFETASARIDDSARDVLNAAANAYEQEQSVVVVIAGHTDTVGAPDVNMLLSQRRAEAVADALSMLGVAPRDMALEAYGQEQLTVPTGDNVDEPRNRRVEVMFRDSGR